MSGESPLKGTEAGDNFGFTKTDPRALPLVFSYDLRNHCNDIGSNQTNENSEMNNSTLIGPEIIQGVS
jgi:hypothetical protein